MIGEILKLCPKCRIGALLCRVVTKTSKIYICDYSECRNRIKEKRS